MRLKQQHGSKVDERFEPSRRWVTCLAILDQKHSKPGNGVELMFCMTALSYARNFMLV